MKLIKNKNNHNFVKIKEVCKVQQGLQIPIEERLKKQEDNSLPYITVQALKNGKIEEFIKNARKSVICNEKEIIVARTGSVGKIIKGISGVFHNNFFKLNIKEQYDVNFVYYFLNSKKIQNTIKRLASVTTIPDLKHSDFYTLDFPNIDIKKQNNIANLLASKEHQIKNLKLLIEKLEKRNQYYANKLLTGELRVREDSEGNIEFHKNPDDNWKEEKVNGYLHKTPMKIPKDWHIVKLKDFINLQKGCSIKSELFNYDENGLQFLRTGDVWDDASSKKEPAFFNGKIDKKFIKNEDDFLFCFEGYNTKINKGTVGLLTDSLKGIVSSHLYKLNNDETTKYYSIFLLKNHYIQNLILRQGMGTTVLSATKSWKTLEFILPKEKSEINIINNILKNQIKEIKTIKKAIVKEKKQFEWLSEKLLSGEYIIKD